MAYDPSIIEEIRREASKISDPKTRMRRERAAFQTGIVETGIQNLDHGDADSKGWRQERQSLYADPTNVKASVRRFFQEAAKLDRGQPSWELAADVQRPAAQFRGRYKQVAKEAAKLAGGSTRASASAAKTTTPARTSTVTTGGDVTAPTLPEREKPPITGPALPDYVKNLPPTVAAPDRSAPQASIRAAIAALGKVPETTTTQTVPAQKVASVAQSAESAATGATKGKSGSEVLELIYNNGGKGYGIKNGMKVDAPSVFNAVWAGHANHVHVAAGKKTIVALGKLAQSLGLRVSENSHFGGEDPGAHVAGSYHNKDQAIDVSAPMTAEGKGLMEEFAKRVASYNKTRKLPAT